MEITDELLDHLSEMAKLSFVGEERTLMKAKLEKMTLFMEQLNEVDTKGVEPLIFMTDEVNVLRDDVPMETITHEEALKNAPKKDSDYIRIPKVIDKTAEA